MCRFCMNPFTQEEQMANAVSMFQSSECYHMYHLPCFRDQVTAALAVKADVEKKALQRSKFENIDKDPRLSDPGDRFYNNLPAWSMFKLAYYMCFKCKKPYFGGMKDCLAAQQEKADFKPEELVCGTCAAVAVGAAGSCKAHGTDFIEFKCKFCCSIAQWFCWGNTHFCEPCHKRQCAGDYVSRKDKS